MDRTATGEPAAHATPVPAALRMMQFGEHVLFAAVLLIGAVQAVVGGLHPVPVVVLSLALAGAYLACTVLAHRFSTTVQYVWLLVLTLLWVVAIVLSPTFAWVAFALFFLYLYRFRPAVALPVVILLALIVVVTLLAQKDGNPAATVIGPLMGAAVAIVVMRIYTDLLRENTERRRAVEAMHVAQADLVVAHDELATLQRATGVLQERERMAREIHDTVAQGLSSILLTARALRTAGDEDPRLEQIESLASENLTEARRIVAALTPAALDRALLADALRRLVDRHQEQTGMPARLWCEGAAAPLPTQYEAALLRVAQSALANVREHSAAQRVDVTLSFLPDAVTLDIVDDGKGFDPGSATAPPGDRATSGFGLRGMASRVAELGGRLDVESALGEGTAVATSLPLPARVLS